MSANSNDLVTLEEMKAISNAYNIPKFLINATKSSQTLTLTWYDPSTKKTSTSTIDLPIPEPPSVTIPSGGFVEGIFPIQKHSGDPYENIDTRWSIFDYPMNQTITIKVNRPDYILVSFYVEIDGVVSLVEALFDKYGEIKKYSLDDPGIAESFGQDYITIRHSWHDGEVSVSVTALQDRIIIDTSNDSLDYSNFRIESLYVSFAKGIDINNSSFNTIDLKGVITGPGLIPENGYFDDVYH